MLRRGKLMVALWLVSVAAGQNRRRRDNAQQRVRANKDRYNMLVETAKRSTDCSGLIADDFSYSCVTHHISPTCFREHLSSRGLEFGQENQTSHNNYYDCLIKQGVLL